MFERYTEPARRLLFFARYEASQFGSRVIDTEHVLLGLIRTEKGIAGRVLADCGVSLERLREEIEPLNTGAEKISTGVEMPFSDSTRRVLLFAEEEANRLRHRHIGTEHLLLALVRHRDSQAGTILARHGLNVDDLRERVSGLVAAPPAVVPEASSPADIAAHVDRLRGLALQLLAAAVDDRTRQLAEQIQRELDDLRGRLPR